jgi:hypothetical protein
LWCGSWLHCSRDCSINVTPTREEREAELRLVFIRRRAASFLLERVRGATQIIRVNLLADRLIHCILYRTSHVEIRLLRV